MKANEDGGAVCDLGEKIVTFKSHIHLHLNAFSMVENLNGKPLVGYDSSIRAAFSLRNMDHCNPAP